MGHSPSPAPVWNRRTLSVAVLVAAIVVLSGGFGALAAGHARTSGSGSPHAGSAASGGVQLSQARASLAHGEGPARAGPLALPLSPGGYSWTNITGLVSGSPSGRLSAMAWDASDGYVVLYGWDSLAGIQRDTWTYANGNWTNITGSVGTPPPVAVFPLMAFDPSSQTVIMYLGENNSTWSYHHNVWTNLTSTAGHPTAIIEATMTTDTADHEVVLMGGIPVYGGAGLNHQTWVFQNGTWRNDTTSAPFNFGRIIIPVAADDPTDHGVVAQGLAEWQNTSPLLYKPATFVFSGNHWTNLTPTLTTEPAMSELPGFAWLGSIGADVMEASFTVNGTGSFNYRSGVTWEFAHDVWTNVTAASGPQPDTGAITTAVGVPTDGTVLMFGGERVTSSPVVYPGTWLFSAPPSVTAGISKGAIDAGQSVSLTGTATNGASPLTYHWNFGDGGNSSALSGTHTYARTGLVTATLTVTDLVGHSVSASASVYVNPALSVTANATPASPANGSWVAFSSTVIGGTGPFTYAWTLGDGATSTSASLGHAYGRTGTYTVSVNVTDAAGVTQGTTFQVTVKAAPSTSSGSGSSSTSLTSGTGLGLLIGIIVLLAVVILLAAMLARRPKTPPGSLQPYAAQPPTPPAGGSPPPGAGGPPS